MRWLALALVLSGCLIKPDRIAATGDGGGSSAGDGGVPGDGAVPQFVPRLISRAYWNDDSGAVSPGMSQSTYSLSTTGVVDGDLVVIIGDIDNSPTVARPTGFSPLVHKLYGIDGQTFFAFYKRATSSEPGAYTGSYTANATSGGSTLVLLAIHGASDDLSVFQTDDDPCVTESPPASYCGDPTVTAPSMGVTTVAANSIVVYAAGADWRQQTSTASFMMAPGFTQLAAFSDKGNADYWWTSLMVGWELAPSVGPTGTITGVLTDVAGLPNRGEFWALAIAVAPQ